MRYNSSKSAQSLSARHRGGRNPDIKSFASIGLSMVVKWEPSRRMSILRIMSAGAVSAKDLKIDSSVDEVGATAGRDTNRIICPGLRRAKGNLSLNSCIPSAASSESAGDRFLEVTNSVKYCLNPFRRC